MGKTTSGRFLVFGLVGLALAAVGCGDDGDALGDFAGTWTYTQSSAHFSCADGTDTSGALNATRHFGRGVKADLVDLSHCDYLFDVKDKVATVQANQTCSFDDGAGTATETASAWVFTLNSASTAEEQFQTATTFSDGVPCTLMATSRLEKLSTD